MTMGNHSEFISAAMPSIINPVLEKISAETSETECSRLNDAFSECEQSDKGIAYHFIELLLRRTDFDSRVNIVDCMQLLSVSPDVEKHPSPEYVNLSERSIALNSILSRIPDEIFDRRKFLETIKDTASAIKYLLDAVNKVVATLPANEQPEVEFRKKEFVKYSKRFSTTLKEFFKYHSESSVFASAEQLISQNNLILKTVSEIDK